MPSKAYEMSCNALVDGVKKFYQCQTCDQTKQLFLCDDCLFNGLHMTHNYTKIQNYSDIVFCNCGDITGRLCCSQHRLIKFQNLKKLPLHFNHEFFDPFIRHFNLTERVGRKLSRLNQIQKVYNRSEDGEMIKQYFTQSNAHNTKMSIRGVYSVFRKDQEKRFIEKGFDKIRRILLWHGTKLTNLESILQNGFRRPNTGGQMFGNGVYFADRVSKSANYTDGQGVEVIFLCEVALGYMFKTREARNYTSPPNPFNSIKGIGEYRPQKEKSGKLFDVDVPFGTTEHNPKSVLSQLKYNEYVIFDPARILIKFIVHFDRN